MIWVSPLAQRFALASPTNNGLRQCWALRQKMWESYEPSLPPFPSSIFKNAIVLIGDKGVWEVFYGRIFQMGQKKWVNTIFSFAIPRAHEVSSVSGLLYFCILCLESFPCTNLRSSILLQISAQMSPQRGSSDQPHLKQQSPHSLTFPISFMVPVSYF